MPRNSSGVYSLPVPPFVSGTVIKSADMNSDLSDIASALTSSLATNGVSVMTAPLPFVAGTVTTPGLAVAGDLNTGIYAVTADTLAITTGGTNVVTFNPDSSVIWSGAQTFNNGILVLNGIHVTSGTVTFDGPTTFQLNSDTFTIDDATTANQIINALGQEYVLTFTIDGGGSVPSTGNKGFITVPCGSTVKAWYIFADQSGSAVVDIQKSSFAGFPPSVSIAGTELPTLSSAQSNSDTNLTTWTTALSAFDVLGFILNSVTTCTRIQVNIVCRRNTQ